jgi:hypothetical protein
MNAQLIELRERLGLNARRAEALVAKAGDSRLAARPAPDSWSAAECLVHLTLSTKMFLPAWRKALAEARSKEILGDGPFKMDLIGKMMNWVLEPPPRLRSKAPPSLLPVASDQTLPEFLASQDRVLRIVAESAGVALDQIKVPSPADSRVRYNVWSSFRVMETHQRRHLWQAERAIALPG